MISDNKFQTLSTKNRPKMQKPASLGGSLRHPSYVIKLRNNQIFRPAYPFTAPADSPDTRNLCSDKNNKMTGRDTRIDPAAK